MILPESLQIEWINKVAKEQKADPGLVEKVIRALSLLEALSKTNIAFVFKGGTSLMLKLGSTRRLSIDIDIIIAERKDDLEQQLEKIVQDSDFIRMVEHERKARSSIEKAHYKFYYKPVTKQSEEDVILLDILFEPVGYTNVEEQEIKNPFLKQDGACAKVAVPSFEDITGDKLTAFAPNTTGIPYQKNGQSASMEIIKQLYDLGHLFDEIADISLIKKTFEVIAKNELVYRELNITVEDVLEDTFQTSLCLSLRGQDGKGDFKELESGIKRIQPFIFSEHYFIDKAITHAAKVAYLTRLLLRDEKEIARFKAPDQVRHWQVEQPANTKLNKLKKTNPEAFFYWCSALQL
jgi:predicted nucleotidyltransferase component of viral defense system